MKGRKLLELSDFDRSIGEKIEKARKNPLHYEKWIFENRVISILPSYQRGS